MKKVSIKDLEATLSSVVADAEAGHTVLINRHNRPVAQVGPAGSVHVHRGDRAGSGRIQAATKRRTKSHSLAMLHVLPAVPTPRSLDLAHLRTAFRFHAVEPLSRFVPLDTAQAEAARELGLPCRQAVGGRPAHPPDGATRVTG